MAYNYQKVRVANERLRKLERIGLYKGYKNPLAKSSVEYQAMRTMAIELPNTKGIIYRKDSNGQLLRNADTSKYQSDKIRFLTKKEYLELTPKQQQYFDEQLDRFLESQTSQKLGIEKAITDAYDKFKKAHSNLSDITLDEYKEFWEQYSERYEQMKEDNKNHYGYDEKRSEFDTSIKERLDLFLNNGSMDQLRRSKRSKKGGLDPKKIDEIFNYVINDVSTPKITKMRSNNRKGKGRRRRT